MSVRFCKNEIDKITNKINFVHKIIQYLIGGIRMNKQDIEKAWQRVCMWIGCTPKENTDAHEVYQIIKKTLEQQLTNGWIPVSERLPEESGHYLVTYHEWSKGEYLPKFDFTCMKILRFYRGEFEMPICCDDKIEQDIGREVLAWRELPEIWRNEDEQQEIEKAAFNINAPKVKNIIGEKYGRLTVIEQRGFTKPNKHGSRHAIWYCRCDCGNYIERTTDVLKRGKSSCGCRQKKY